MSSDIETWVDPIPTGDMPPAPLSGRRPAPSDGVAVRAGYRVVEGRLDVSVPAAVESGVDLDMAVDSPNASRSVPDDEDKRTRVGAGEETTPDTAGPREANKSAETSAAPKSRKAAGVIRRVCALAGPPAASSAWCTSASASTSVRTLRGRLPSVHWRLARSNHRCANPIRATTCSPFAGTLIVVNPLHRRTQTAGGRTQRAVCTLRSASCVLSPEPLTNIQAPGESGASLRAPAAACATGPAYADDRNGTG